MARSISVLLALAPLLLCTCGAEQSPSNKSADRGAEQPPTKVAEPEPEPIPEQPAPPEPSLPLADYLAAISHEQPSLTEQITGTAGAEPADIERCKEVNWTDSECERRFPRQGVVWLRWACMDPAGPKRGGPCTRLANYIYRGVGGPKNREFAHALFERECDSSNTYYSINCCTAAETVAFDEPERALEYERASKTNGTVGCGYFLHELQAGLKPLEIVVEQVTGLSDVVVGSECRAWIWSAGALGCGGRLTCGERVLYGDGFDGSYLKCEGHDDDKTSRTDGDPSFRFDGDIVEMRDDETGRLGAFTFRGRVKASPSAPVAGQ